MAILPLVEIQTLPMRQIFQTATCVSADTLNYGGGGSTVWIFNRQWVQVNTEMLQNSDQVTCNLFVLIKQNQDKQQAGEAYIKLLLTPQKSKAAA